MDHASDLTDVDTLDLVHFHTVSGWLHHIRFASFCAAVADVRHFRLDPSRAESMTTHRLLTARSGRRSALPDRTIATRAAFEVPPGERRTLETAFRLPVVEGTTVTVVAAFDESMDATARPQWMTLSDETSAGFHWCHGDDRRWLRALDYPIDVAAISQLSMPARPRRRVISYETADHVLAAGRAAVVRHA